MIEGLHTTWASVYDMDRATSFYRGLGLETGYASEWWTEFPLPNGKFALHKGSPQPGGWVLGVVCRDLDRLAAKVQELGGTVVGRHETPNGMVLEFKDVDGNTVQAMHPND